jgi:hypothetical protein
LSFLLSAPHSIQTGEKLSTACEKEANGKQGGGM